RGLYQSKTGMASARRTMEQKIAHLKRGTPKTPFASLLCFTRLSTQTSKNGAKAHSGHKCGRTLTVLTDIRYEARCESVIGLICIKTHCGNRSAPLPMKVLGIKHNA